MQEGHLLPPVVWHHHPTVQALPTSRAHTEPAGCGDHCWHQANPGSGRAGPSLGVWGTGTEITAVPRNFPEAWF